MRLGWYSNAPWAGTGYGVQTYLHGQYLLSQGHDVAVFANYGLMGARLEWNGLQVFPMSVNGADATSTAIMPFHAEVAGSDVIVTLYDAHEFDDDVKFNKPWAAYFPLDQEPMPERIRRPLERCQLPIAMSRFGQDAAAAKDIRAEYLPHGYAASDYHVDAAAADEVRPHLDAADRFVVGVVGANKGAPGLPCRKSFDQIIEGYADFYRKHDDALLYLHALALPTQGGVDLKALCDEFELPKRAYHIAGQYAFAGFGVSTPTMRGLYNSMDVLLSPSMGEGFGVPIVEAQACGTKPIVGGWTAMPEVARSGYTIPKDLAYAHHVSKHSLQWIPHPSAITEALEIAYEDGKPSAEDRARVAGSVAEYEINHVCAEYWPPIIEKLERIVAESQQMPTVNREQRRKQARAKQKTAVA